MTKLKSFCENLENITYEKAKEILKALFDLKSFEEDLTDEQIETLLDIDENPEKFDEYLKKKEEKEAKERAKEEKAASKIKRKKTEEKEKGKEGEVKEKPRSRVKKTKVAEETKETTEIDSETKTKTAEKKRKTKKETHAEETKVLEAGEIIEGETKKRKGVKKTIQEDVEQDLKEKKEEVKPVLDKKEEVKNVEILEPTIISKEAVSNSKKETQTLPVEPTIEQKTIHRAEIVSEEEIQPSKKVYVEEVKKKKKPKEQSAGISIGGAVEETEPVVEIVLSNGTRTRIDDMNFDEKLLIAQAAEANAEEISEVEEETYRYEFEERKKHKKLLKHLPVPDPDVVAKVKKESEERLKRKKEKNRPKEVIREVIKEVVVDKEHLFQGKKEKEGRFDKKEKRRGKPSRYEPIFNEQEIMKEAAAVVKEFESSGSVFHLKKKKRRKERTSIFEDSMEKVEVPVIEVPGPMTVESLSQALEVSPSDIIVDLMDLNIMATKNQLIDLDTIRFIAQKYGVEIQLVIPEEEEILVEETDNPEDLVPRAPVVTVMGHVDHGKTSLLDRVRSTNVAATESGNITQHIAAYEVMTPSGKVVFLDTPGHEAFTQMRARGAKITDIVVLVVAADDGVQPQTIEAIDHAKAAEVSIIVAINKCDKPDAQPDRVRQELVAYDLVDEAWGGKTIMKNISAKTGEGVNELLELILLQSQMMELKANPKKKARGTVIEAEISRGFGPVAWVLVQNGTLRTGDACLVGSTFGKIRAMFNSKGELIREAPPSTPVLISGLEELPEAGDTFVVVDDEKKAKLIAEKRQEIKKLQKGEPAKAITLEDFHTLVELGEQKKLYILIKADVQGSADVLKSSLSGLGNEQVGVEIVRSSVGEINETDVLLAQVSKAVIISFNVGVNPRAQKLAEETGVEIRKYEIIYDILEDVRKALSGLLKPIVQEVTVGHAEIRQIFKSSSLGNIAGCSQLDGVTPRGALVRVIRNGKVICEDRISSLKRGKDDVREVATGFECGIKLEKFDDIKEGDIIESYRLEEIRPSLN